MVVLKKAQDKNVALKGDAFGKYLERSVGNTTVNGSVVARKFSWYKKILGLF